MDIINFDNIKNFQAFKAVPHVKDFSVLLTAPFGWVLDIKDPINNIVSLFQRGLTLKEAQKKNEWMYVNFWKKTETIISVEGLIELQNSNNNRIDSNAQFSYKSNINRKDNSVNKIRIVDAESYPVLEVTGFIDFEDYIFFIVLFTPKELLNKNLRKLQYLILTATPAKITFNNTIVINSLIAEIPKTKNLEEKAKKYHQIAIWYIEMNELDNAIINLKNSVDCFPSHYSSLKYIIKESLKSGNYYDAKTYTNKFFEVNPKNPRVLQDLIEIYLDNNKPRLIEELFVTLIDDNNDLETLGNLHFHLGQIFNITSNNNEAQQNFKKAKINFK